MAAPSQCTRDINWVTLNLPRVDLLHLDKPSAISQLPLDSAPGPDGFIGVFFKKCWHIIRGDVMAAINSFHNLHTGTSI
jgi:hypothetical protein